MNRGPGFQAARCTGSSPLKRAERLGFRKQSYLTRIPVTGVHISIGGKIADFVGFCRLMEQAAHRKF